MCRAMTVLTNQVPLSPLTMKYSPATWGTASGSGSCFVPFMLPPKTWTRVNAPLGRRGSGGQPAEHELPAGRNPRGEPRRSADLARQPIVLPVIARAAGREHVEPLVRTATGARQ